MRMTKRELAGRAICVVLSAALSIGGIPTMALEEALDEQVPAVEIADEARSDAQNEVDSERPDVIVEVADGQETMEDEEPLIEELLEEGSSPAVEPSPLIEQEEEALSLNSGVETLDVASEPKVDAIELQAQGDGDVLSDPEAWCFLAFLFGTDNLTDEQLNGNDFYRLLTGQLSGEYRTQVAIEFLRFEDAQLAMWSKNIGLLTNRSQEILIDYLESKVGDDVVGSAANDLINEALHSVSMKGLDFMTDSYLMHGGDLEDAEYELFWMTKLGWDEIKSLKGIRAKVMAERDRLAAILSTEVFVVGVNKGEMYNYYITYRDALSLGEYADIWMDAYRVSNERLHVVEMFDSWLATTRFDESFNLWATEEREALLERFAQYSYGLECEVRESVPLGSGGAEVDEPSYEEEPIPAPQPVTGEHRSGDWEYNKKGDGTACIVRYDGSAMHARIPALLGGLSVTEVGELTFVDTPVESVDFAGSISSIGAAALSGMKNVLIRGPEVHIYGDMAPSACTMVVLGALTTGNVQFNSCDVVVNSSLSHASLAATGSSVSVAGAVRGSRGGSGYSLAASSLECGSLAGCDLRMSGGSSVVSSGDVSLVAFREMGDGDLLSVGGKLTFDGNPSGWDTPRLEGGTVELRGDAEYKGCSLCLAGDGHLTVLCGEGPQTVTDSSDYAALKHVVNAHENKSEVTLPNNTGAYIHDPTYKTGDRYIQIATCARDVQYTGDTTTPPIKYGSKTLVEGTDYEIVESSDSERSEPGAHTITIKGLAPYKGEKTYTYRVTSADLSFATVAYVADVVYDGHEHKPKVTLTWHDGHELIEGTDYHLSYWHNIEVGRAGIIVIGCGDYAGTMNVGFYIVPTAEGQKMIDRINALQVRTLADEDAFVELRQAYSQMEWVDQNSVTNAYLLDRAEQTLQELHDAKDTLSSHIDELADMLLRFTIDSDGCGVDERTPWMSAEQREGFMSVLDAAGLVMKDPNSEFGVLNNALEELDGTIGTVRLMLEEQHGTLHIEAEREENRTEATCEKAGSYDIVTYCDECGKELLRTTVVIAPLGHDYDADLVDPTWDAAGYVLHRCNRCGDEYRTDYTACLRDSTAAKRVDEAISALPSGKDLTIDDAQDVASTRASFDALSDDQKSLVRLLDKLVSAERRVEELRDAAARVRFTEAVILGMGDQVYTGSVLRPISLRYGGELLVEGKDYVINYQGNINCGTARVTITSLGRYTGSRRCVFKVIAASIAKASVSPIAAKTYSGSAFEPLPTLKIGGKTLKRGTDYSLSYANNVKAGTATVTITGRGNYKGTLTKRFTIKPAVQTISVSSKTIAMGKTVGIGAKASAGGKLTYKSSNVKVVKVDPTGKVIPVKVGTATVTVTAAAVTNYTKVVKDIKVTVSKGGNTLATKVKKKTVAVKLSSVRKAKVALANNVIVSNAKGIVTYGNASGNVTAKEFIVNSKTGKITIPKGTKKGTYVVKVKVTARGNANWKKGSKTVSFKVKVA